jgi:hypothetical protein
MLRAGLWISSALLGLSALVFVPTAAEAKPKVEWSHVDVPESEDAARIGKVLKAALEQAAKHANFGKVKSITLSAKLLTFTTEQHGDVLRVSCTAMGRVAGGASARSKISFGGSPDARAELEKQVLTMVANGLVSRLAQIARAQAPK